MSIMSYFHARLDRAFKTDDACGKIEAVPSEPRTKLRSMGLICLEGNRRHVGYGRRGEWAGQSSSSAGVGCDEHGDTGEEEKGSAHLERSIFDVCSENDKMVSVERRGGAAGDGLLLRLTSGE